ncbi:MAG: hypothetical protein JW731_05080 [Bacteroidales bacterium]|nr:hypothetical protein [Bacteroidales bacterium]
MDKRKLVLSVVGLLALMIAISCNNSAKVSDTQNGKNNKEEMKDKSRVKAGPPVIIYKTRDDYANRVPVTLNEDKTAIANFPGIKDIYFKGEFAIPTQLKAGWLLDNRGIDQNVAFLEYTYDEYSKLGITPTGDELYQKILDKDPLAEMYKCGTRFDYKDLVTELNQIIDSEDFSSCIKLQ